MFLFGYLWNFRSVNCDSDSEVPLGGDGGVPEEGLAAGGVLVVDEIVGEFPLRAQREVLVEVVP